MRLDFWVQLEEIIVWSCRSLWTTYRWVGCEDRPGPAHTVHTWSCSVSRWRWMRWESVLGRPRQWCRHRQMTVLRVPSWSCWWTPRRVSAVWYARCKADSRCTLLACQRPGCCDECWNTSAPLSCTSSAQQISHQTPLMSFSYQWNDWRSDMTFWSKW